MEKKYDLEERTVAFAEKVMDYCSSLQQNLIGQLFDSSSSVAANYAEANSASSKKDFRNKIAICKKESQETKVWLRLSQKLNGRNDSLRQQLTQECQELILIFGKILSSLRQPSV